MTSSGKCSPDTAPWATTAGHRSGRAVDEIVVSGLKLPTERGLAIRPEAPSFEGPVDVTGLGTLPGGYRCPARLIKASAHPFWSRAANQTRTNATTVVSALLEPYLNVWP